MTLYLRIPFQSPNYRIHLVNCDHLYENICVQYGHFTFSAARADSYCIAIQKADDGVYSIEHKSGSKITRFPLKALEDVIFETTTYDENVLPLHGAAVEYGGSAYVFLAPTMSGKTTLTAYLVHNGFNYISEDCIIIDKKTIAVHPYRCHMRLRAGGVDVLKRHGINISGIKIVHGYEGVRYVFDPTNRSEVPVPLGGILFTKRSESINRIDDIGGSENIMELMKSAMNVFRPSGEHIQFLSKLAGIGCKRLLYKDMEFVKDVIINGYKFTSETAVVT